MDMGCHYTYFAEDNVLAGTLDLWKVSHTMPRRLHEQRRFTFDESGITHVCTLDISSRGTYIEESVLENGRGCGRRRYKVDDMYLEDGALHICSRPSILKRFTRAATA